MTFLGVTTPYYGGKQVKNPANVIPTSGAPSSAITAANGTLAVDNAAGVMYGAVSQVGGVVTWAILGGATGAVATETGDTGTATPAAGNIKHAGTANQITTAASGATVTYSLPSAITAPGSLTTTTTLTGGTGVTATTGNVVSTAGQVNAATTMTAGTGITSTTGNIEATAGQVNAGTTMTAGTGITSTTGNIEATAGQVNAGTTMTAGTGITATTGSITATAGQLIAGGDTGGVASTTSITNTVSSTISTGVGSVKMSTGNAATNTEWIKIYVGTDAFWIPAWTTNAP